MNKKIFELGLIALLLVSCFATISAGNIQESPENDLEIALNEKKYDYVGFTIRNIDSALFYNNEFFLPEFKKYIKVILTN